MSPSRIIASIERCGGNLVLREGAVRIQNPRAVSEELRDTARALREQIAAVLVAIAGSPQIDSFWFWSGIYQDIESWPPRMQARFVSRTDAIESSGLSRERAEA